MKYPITIDKIGNSFLVTFPDVPEALTQGNSIEECLVMAKDALKTALEFYTNANQTLPLPLPSTTEQSQYFVEL
jgi:antitoxin HicB